jgi:hypothetical protein
MNCDLLLKVNPVQGQTITPLMTELPSIYNESSDFVNQILFKYSTSLFAKRKLEIYSTSRDYYTFSNGRISKIENIFDYSYNISQVGLCPRLFESSSYLISAGNDRIIRYWDLAKELKNSFLINCPNSFDYCCFTNCNFGSSTILQSNEFYDTGLPKRQSSFSEYQNFNGLSFHLTVQPDFDSNEEVLKYSTKISDCSHKGIITDLNMLSIQNSQTGIQNLLLSSSWDGTIKIWK